MPGSISDETVEVTMLPSELDEGDFTDAELTVLALAADPDEQVHPDAIPFTTSPASDTSYLPSWYMPTPTARVRSRRQTAVVVVIVLALLLIEALGLCITYGQLVVA